MHLKIRNAEQSDHSELIALWERSVRSSHNFLCDNDISIYKKLLQTSNFYGSKLICIINLNQLTGFIGIKEDHIQQLFIDPGFTRAGLGSQLIAFAIKNYKVKYVQVNQQNHSAISFYHRHNFRVQGNQLIDGAGLAYPILDMELKNQPQNTITIIKRWIASLF